MRHITTTEIVAVCDGLDARLHLYTGYIRLEEVQDMYDALVVYLSLHQRQLIEVFVITTYPYPGLQRKDAAEAKRLARIYLNLRWVTEAWCNWVVTLKENPHAEKTAVAPARRETATGTGHQGKRIEQRVRREVAKTPRRHPGRASGL